MGQPTRQFPKKGPGVKKACQQKHQDVTNRCAWIEPNVHREYIGEPDPTPTDGDAEE